MTGLRSLLRVPALTLTIVLTVGIGMGATVAIFSAVDAALLRPLPYPEPERLFRLYTHAPPYKFRFSAVDYLALREQQTHFEESATYTDRSMIFTDGASSEVLRARLVSWSFLSVLRVRPVFGRDFTEDDGRTGAPPTVMVSHALWQRRLGARTGAVGQTITLDGVQHTVVGVLPERTGPLERRQDLLVIQQFSPPPRKGPFLYSVVARLRAGVDPSVAESELRMINARLFPIWKSSYQDDKATWAMEDLQTAVIGNVQGIAALATISVALVWMMACSNASHLLMTRVAARRRELAVRVALGASRRQIVRHLLEESALLCGGAVIIGTVVAVAGIRLLQVAAADYFPRTAEMVLGAPELSLLAALALCNILLFGLIPAVQGTRGSSDEGLVSKSRAANSDDGVRRARRALVVGQFALATPLLIIAGLLLSSLSQLNRVDIGFDPHNVITGSIRLPAAQYRDSAATVLWETLTARVAALPGVTAIAYADGLPPNGVGNINNFDLEDAPTPPGQSQPTAPWVATTPGYFRVLGLTLIEGRLLEERDALTQQVESVVVDRAWARRFFPTVSAVGKRFREGGCTTCPWTTVVGVVSEVKYLGLDQPDSGTVYWPLAPQSLTRFFVARADGNAGAVLGSIQRVVREVDSSAALSATATMEDLIAQSLERPRSLSLLVATFAGVALLLSVVGVYGVMAHYVQQHLKEIGIRMALGGTASDVFRLIVGQGMAVVGAGILFGLFIALGSSRYISSLLFGVGAADAATYALVSLGLLVIALAACVLPAGRAIRIQPAVVLRNE